MMKTNDIQKDLQEKRAKFVPRGVSNGNLAIADHGKNATLVDKAGNEWIDFAGAIGTLNVGHTHSKVTEAIKNQVDKFLHPGFNCMMYEGYIRVAEKLVELTPGEFDKQAILFNSGAEAVENAVKIARMYTNRQAVVTFQRGFHGRTNLTMGMTSKVKPYKFGFGPFTPEIYQAPFPYMYQKPAEMSEEGFIEEAIKQFEAFFVEIVAPEMVACIVMELIQGEGGFIIPPKAFVQHVREFCTKHGILFVADEIQTGFGRTGKMFAIESHFGVVPDLMTISKSLAAGMPLSAVVGRTDVMEVPEPGQLGGTFAGNPVACEAALAVMDVMEEENLCERAEGIGEKIEKQLSVYAGEYHFVGGIRRLGAIVAVEIISEDGNPDPTRTSKIAKYANEHGLLLLTAGINGNVIRFLPPLVTTDDELKKGFAILTEAFASVK